MKRVLVLFAHPALEKSRVNRVLIRAPSDLEGVTFRDLYELYPDFDIEVAEEQRTLLAHDIILWHHPFYWYSAPALLKQWKDLVLEHDWAYGRRGNALRGKIVMNVLTAGGPESAYQPGGFNQRTIAQFLWPFEQTARLCGMTYLPPFVVHATHLMQTEEIERHRRDYARLLMALRDERVDLVAVQTLARINVDLDALLGSTGQTSSTPGASFTPDASATEEKNSTEETSA